VGPRARRYLARAAYLVNVTISDADLARARTTRPYRSAVWVGRLALLVSGCWFGFALGSRSPLGIVTIVLAVVGSTLLVVAEVLLVRSGIPFESRYFDWSPRGQRVSLAFWRDVLWSGGR
jgi:hypothetical protein